MHIGWKSLTFRTASLSSLAWDQVAVSSLFLADVQPPAAALLFAIWLQICDQTFFPRFLRSQL